MWPSIFRFGAVLCLALAVKLMDDLLDSDLGRGDLSQAGFSRADPGRVEQSISNARSDTTSMLPGGPGGALGAGGVAAYALGLGMVAAALNAEWAVTLLLASYAVGMLDDPVRRLPSRLPAGGESLLAILIGIMAYGWRSAVASLACIVVIQALDDLVDYRSDLQAGRRNWVAATGKFEVAVIAIIWLIIGLSLDWMRLAASAAAAWLVTLVVARVSIKSAAGWLSR